VILAVNIGSSTLKYAAYDLQDGRVGMAHSKGLVDGLDALDAALGRLAQDLQQQLGGRPIRAMAHRVVHGGGVFDGPVLLDASVLSTLETFSDLAPLHQPHNIRGARACMAAFPGTPQVACFDTVTARIVTEPGARVAGLRTGELHAVEDIPTTSVADLKKNPAVSILPLENWWIHITSANNSQPPTDNVKFRQAVQAVLDMDEIMEAATDGNYKLNVGFQYPHQASYTDAGKETYNQQNAAKAKALLAEAGY
jgi:hypothetical protein